MNVQDLIHNNHQLPANLTSIGGHVDLKGYNHQLPANLKIVAGQPRDTKA